MGHGMIGIRFAPDGDGGAGGAGGGASDDAQSGAQGAQGGDAGAQSQDGGNGAQGGSSAGSGDGKTFTQADVDRIVQERLAREKQRHEQELEAERQKAGMQETERLKLEKEQAEKAAADARAEAERAVIAAETKLAAVALNTRADRLDDVAAKVDVAGLELVDGKLDGDKVRAAVQAVLEQYPEWKQGPTQQGSSGGDQGSDSGPRSFTAAEVAAMTAEEYAKNRDEIMAAMRSGRLRQ